MSKIFFLFVSSLLIAQNSQAVILARCSGMKLPNGISYSFELVQEADAENVLKSRVEVYSQDTAVAPVKHFATERCQAFWMEEQILVCNTIYETQYRVDPITKTAEEVYEGEASLYDTCTFPDTK